MLSAYKAQKITKDNCILIQRSTTNQECIHTLKKNRVGICLGGEDMLMFTITLLIQPCRNGIQLQSSLSHSQIVFRRVLVPSTCPMHVCRVTEHRCSILSCHQCLLWWSKIMLAEGVLPRPPSSLHHFSNGNTIHGSCCRGSSSRRMHTELWVNATCHNSWGCDWTTMGWINGQKELQLIFPPECTCCFLVSF